MPAVSCAGVIFVQGLISFGFLKLGIDDADVLDMLLLAWNVAATAQDTATEHALKLPQVRLLCSCVLATEHVHYRHRFTELLRQAPCNHEAAANRFACCWSQLSPSGC